MGIGAGTDVEDSGEISVIRKLLRETKNELIVFDVGANKGQFLNFVASHLGQRIKEVHSFEPAATTYATLKANAPSDPKYRLLNCGLSHTEGSAQLFYDKENSGLASLTKRNLDFRNIPFEQAENVILTTIDAYCDQYSISNIDWLKLDVEGHELDVLRGARKMFESGAVKLVTFEFGGCNVDTRTFFRDFFEFFKALGMTIYRITPNGHFHPIRRYRETEEQFSTINYVVFKDAI
jgi:FkbM family methyltransferase